VSGEDVYEKGMTRDQFIDALEADYNEARYTRGCTCFRNPPCSFCTDGYSLDFEEYLELELEWFDEDDTRKADTAADAYDRAMGIFK
jgi:hypothetical protein